MVALIQTSILGVLMITCAGDFEIVRKIGFILIFIGNFGSIAIYERLKERIEKIEKQLNKKAKQVTTTLRAVK